MRGICFGTVPAYDRQKDRQTDGRTQDDSIYRASIASRGKNVMYIDDLRYSATESNNRK